MGNLKVHTHLNIMPQNASTKVVVGRFAGHPSLDVPLLFLSTPAQRSRSTHPSIHATRPTTVPKVSELNKGKVWYCLSSQEVGGSVFMAGKHQSSIYIASSQARTSAEISHLFAYPSGYYYIKKYEGEREKDNETSLFDGSDCYARISTFTQPFSQNN